MVGHIYSYKMAHYSKTGPKIEWLACPFNFRPEDRQGRLTKFMAAPGVASSFAPLAIFL
jgi:hypothetical protein